MSRLLLGALLIAILYTVFVEAVQAHYQPGLHNTRHAVNLAWCGRSNTYCAASSEAWEVARCETGGKFNVYAQNGQYLGLFQMGSYARSRYGHAWNPWGQARAAHRYYRDVGGWGPWQCKPWDVG